jgi:hypothetical protein
MKTRNLIVIFQEYSIVCDNKNCDYKVKNITGDPYIDKSEFVNMPCPICCENLLTEQDYNQTQVFLRNIRWANKWLGWLSIFFGTQTVGKQIDVHIHKGINITI